MVRGPRPRTVVGAALVAALALACLAACSIAPPVFPSAPPRAGVADQPPAPTGPTDEAVLVRVVDGDTIRVRVGGREERVRYIGMDTPELNAGSTATPQPWAVAATQENARLLANGRLVLERDVSERDRYDRLLRDVWIQRDGGWTLVDLALVAEGFARLDTVPPDVKYVDRLRAAQAAARDAHLGLWGP